MPIYEYRCSGCGFGQEILQKLSDKPLRVCPKCRRRKLSKSVTAAGFHLKGTGWYQTDFKTSGKQPKKEPAKEAPKEAKKEDSAATCGAGACPACKP
ncbi:MAG: FmdB family zinc ribbon protein [Burkholderiales bacterium]